MAQNRRARLLCEHLECRRLMTGNLDLTAVEFRTIDGTNNNLLLPDQGAAETRQIRFGYGAQFPDGFGDAIIVRPQRANPRTIRKKRLFTAYNGPMTLWSIETRDLNDNVRGWIL